MHLHTYIIRRAERAGRGRGNHDAVSDLHMANKTVSHFRMQNQKPKWLTTQQKKKNEQKADDAINTKHEALREKCAPKREYA